MHIHKGDHRKYTEGPTKKGQSRETGSTGYIRRRQTEQKHNAICVGHHYAIKNTNSVNKTWATLITTGGRGEPNIVSMQKT